MAASSSLCNASSRACRSFAGSAASRLGYLSSARNRNFISPAALCVNVTAAIWSILAPAFNTETIRSTSAVVLPVPADASTIKLSPTDSRIRRRAPSSVAGWAARWRMSSCHPPNLDQCFQPFVAPVLMLFVPLLFVGTAKAAVIAAVAGFFLRRGRQESVGDARVYVRQQPRQDLPRFFVDLNMDHVIGAALRRIEQTTGRDAVTQDPLRGEAVQQRLQ